MAKSATRYICQNCGASFLRWSGQCASCSQWNTLVETIVAASKKSSSLSRQVSAATPIKLSQIRGKDFARTPTGINELNRVLGGGIVPGSVILLAGEPGIGKSTLLTQLALKLKGEIVYVCGEESPEQIKLRIDRVGGKSVTADLSFLPQMDVDVVTETIRSLPNVPKLVIVDSVQTMSTSDLTGMAGSVGQIRECAYRLQNLAKETGMPVILVGHVTKEGAIAGPKILEHLVDTVLYLEGDQKHTFRILRAQKNRFGSVDEVGVFLMEEKGLIEVSNPSDIFLEETQAGVAGSVIVAAMEGTRPVLVEIQGLVVPTSLAIPRRIGTGVDHNRLQLLVAVLTKRAGFALGTMDVYVNVAGGLKLTEPAADLAICLAIASSFKNKALPPKSVAIGEVGLLGEVRRVSFLTKRINESKNLGYRQIIGPEQFRSIRQALSTIAGS